MLSLRSLILYSSLPALLSLPRVAANLRFETLDAAAPDPLPALTLRPQEPGFNFDLQSALSPASNTVTELSVLPGDCSTYLGPEKECTTTMTATNVNFEDCRDPFTICRCDNAKMKMDTILDRLGSVPIGLRRYMGIVMVLGDTETHAYTLTNGDIHFFGDCAMDTWIHEASHSFDFATTTPHSSAPGWAQAIATDSCAPDNYSLTNQVEDFAQMSVVKIYMLLYDGHLPPGFRADCMSHQLDFMDTLPIYNATSLFGNTCAINDSLPGTRHYTPPATLDASRTFKTVSFDFTPAIRTAVSPSPSPSTVPLPDHAGSPSIHRPNDANTSRPLPSLALMLGPQEPGFNFDLESALPPAYITSASALTPLPDNCAAYLGDGNECTSTMLALAVAFEDCADPFLVCRCDDANVTMDAVLDRFGRVPVGLRRYVGPLNTGDNHYFGDCNMDTWIHESTHSFDFANAIPQSSSIDWSQAIALDSCVPDNYSLTNQVEDFAQVGVIKTYMLLYDGNLPLGFSADCMSNQLDFMAALPVYNAPSLFGNTCAINDGGPGARHNTPPSVLDPSRTFETVSFNDAGAAATPVTQNVPTPNSSRRMKSPLLLYSSVMLQLVGVW
ncbi:hypothetical protein B0H10DRAFT_2437663 [Mycena sp. CBHHK59/15]|nr:hypothetical protein B0H10DRAFT_2437663 [Mycena sp. CBHHK59/15]